jgi:hypothetical protein
VPESTFIVIRHGEQELRPFTPAALEPVG